jgi:hypothetical protein
MKKKYKTDRKTIGRCASCRYFPDQDMIDDYKESVCDDGLVTCNHQGSLNTKVTGSWGCWNWEGEGNSLKGDCV